MEILNQETFFYQNLGVFGSLTLNGLIEVTNVR
jgi:hypothetical protein